MKLNPLWIILRLKFFSLLIYSLNFLIKIIYRIKKNIHVFFILFFWNFLLLMIFLQLTYELPCHFLCIYFPYYFDLNPFTIFHFIYLEVIFKMKNCYQMFMKFRNQIQRNLSLDFFLKSNSFSYLFLDFVLIFVEFYLNYYIMCHQLILVPLMRMKFLWSFSLF